MDTKSEKKPPKEIQYIGLRLEKSDFRLSKKTERRIRRIGLWLERSKEFLRHRIIGKPGG